MEIDYASAISKFNQGFNSMIGGLGKNHTLYFKDTIVTAPSEQEDDFIFGGNRRPNYKQESTIEVTKNTKVIKGLFKWNPKDFELEDLRTQFPQGFVRIKTYITHLPDIMRADYIVIDSDLVQSMGEIRCRLIREPVSHGLGKNSYCVSYWERIKT